MTHGAFILFKQTLYLRGRDTNETHVPKYPSALHRILFFRVLLPAEAMPHRTFLVALASCAERLQMTNNDNREPIYSLIKFFCEMVFA